MPEHLIARHSELALDMVLRKDDVKTAQSLGKALLPVCKLVNPRIRQFDPVGR
jgi:hypothetical protein